ncbi:hypothetical protein [Halomonas sp. CSM-2]|uniref:hypothetical protein n=1 Tax=Halomonas sp. CSM-2 TaxID=1975722 RepID=UPI00159375CD|nr:hypothetical protein [Halomonas sp. CSM-2]
MAKIQAADEMAASESGSSLEERLESAGIGGSQQGRRLAGTPESQETCHAVLTCWYSPPCRVGLF